MIAQKQLHLKDIFEECQKTFEEDKPRFLQLLEEYIDLGALIPERFWSHFYASTGRPREHSLTSLLWALVIQRLFSIPTDSLLLVFLTYSKDIREFCGFTRVPDASRLTRFKQEFVDELQEFFDRLVDITEPICQELDAEKASMTIFDTTGIEAYVTENNPKYANSQVRRLAAWAKAKHLDSYDPYKAAYGTMPTHASANAEIKQQYLNGHFCYAYKAGILTNRLGLARAIEFYDEDYFSAHPEIARYKKTDAPDEDKSVGDSRLLLPLLKDFYAKHTDIHPGTFLGDSAFDSIEIYKALLTGDTFGSLPDGTARRFHSAYIPLRSAAAVTNPDYTVNEDGIPCCPHDPVLPMKPEGNTSHLRCGTPTFKFVCPKCHGVNVTTGNTDVSVIVKIPAPVLPAVEWFIFTRNKTFAFIPARFVAPSIGILLIKYAPLWNAPSTTLKTFSVFRIARHKTQERFIPTSCSPVLRSY